MFIGNQAGMLSSVKYAEFSVLVFMGNLKLLPFKLGLGYFKYLTLWEPRCHDLTFQKTSIEK
jgi:hypothetical protein